MNLNDRHYGDGTIWQRKDGTGSAEIQYELPEPAPNSRYAGERLFLVESSTGRTYTIRKSTLDQRYEI